MSGPHTQIAGREANCVRVQGLEDESLMSAASSVRTQPVLGSRRVPTSVKPASEYDFGEDNIDDAIMSYIENVPSYDDVSGEREFGSLI